MAAQPLAVTSQPELHYWPIYRQIPEIWRILKAFDSKFFGLAKCARPVYLHVFAYVLICRFTIFELADVLKIHDIKWKCESFESRSMALNTSYQICLQNVETDYLEIFAKCWTPVRFLVKYKAKGKRALNDWFPVKKLMFWLEVWRIFAEFGHFWSESGDSFVFLSGNLVAN